MSKNENVKFIAYSIEAEKETYDIESIFKSVYENAKPEPGMFTDVANLTKALKRFIPEGVTNVTKFLNIDTDDNNIIISNRNTGKKVVVFDILVQYMENDSSIRIYSIYHNNESFECTVEKNLKMKID